jgi:SAM-dependent methyltransferase
MIPDKLLTGQNKSLFERLPRGMRKFLATPLTALSGNCEKYLTPEESEQLTNYIQYTEKLSHVVGNILQKHIVPIDVNNNAPRRVLEIAAINGMLSQDLKQRSFDVSVMDIDQSKLNSIKKEAPTVKTINADMNAQLPFEDFTFDGVTTLLANRYITKPEHFLQEVHRVLKPQGVFIWPFLKEENLDWIVNAGLSNAISPEALAKIAKEKGFSMATIEDKAYETNNLRTGEPGVASLKILVLIS